MSTPGKRRGRRGGGLRGLGDGREGSGATEGRHSHEGVNGG